MADGQTPLWHPDDGVVRIEYRVAIGTDIDWPDDRRKYKIESRIGAEDWFADKAYAFERTTIKMRREMVREITGPFDA